MFSSIFYKYSKTFFFCIPICDGSSGLLPLWLERSSNESLSAESLSQTFQAKHFLAVLKFFQPSTATRKRDRKPSRSSLWDWNSSAAFCNSVLTPKFFAVFLYNFLIPLDPKISSGISIEDFITLIARSFGAEKDVWAHTAKLQLLTV